jgi:hypothetical protein
MLMGDRDMKQMAAAIKCVRKSSWKEAHRQATENFITIVAKMAYDSDRTFDSSSFSMAAGLDWDCLGDIKRAERMQTAYNDTLASLTRRQRIKHKTEMVFWWFKTQVNTLLRELRKIRVRAMLGKPKNESPMGEEQDNG